MTDAIDWTGALRGSSEQARAIREADAPEPLTVTHCRCGATEVYGRETRPAADLRGADVDVMPADAVRRCRTCPHGIHKGAMHIRYTPPRSAYSDYFHPACALI